MPCLAAAYAALHFHASMTAVLACVLLAWHVPEILLAKTLKWHVSWVTPIVFILRDVMLPVLYIDAWCTNHFVWRGHEMTVRGKETSTERG